MAMDHPSLTDGWWAVEKDGEQLRRWTTGNALLPLPPGATMVEIEMTAGSSYPVEVAWRSDAAQLLRRRRRSLRQATSAIGRSAASDPIYLGTAGLSDLNFSDPTFSDLGVVFGWRNREYNATAPQPGSDWLAGSDMDESGAKPVFSTPGHFAQNGRNSTAEIVSMAIAAQASSID
jgi:hypothetical protein